MAGAFGEIGQYDPNTGALVAGSSFLVPSFTAHGENIELFEDTAQIATDSAGNVYVPNVPENRVLEYNEKGELQHEFTGSGKHALSGPTGVAVDSSGDVWVADDGNNRIEEFEGPTGAFLSEIKSEGVRALALDGQGDVFAIVYNGADGCGGLPSPCDHLVEYSSAGAQLADVGRAPSGSAGQAGPPFVMVAVEDASERVYVTDGLQDVVHVYQPPVLPTVGRESAAEVGVFEAKLGAVATPGGGETSYRFEYDTRGYAAGEGPHGVSVPFPEGSVGQGFSARTVWASAKGLAPGTTYHYRAVVTNGVGSVAGPDRDVHDGDRHADRLSQRKLSRRFLGGSARLPRLRGRRTAEQGLGPASHRSEDLGGYHWQPTTATGFTGRRLKSCPVRSRQAWRTSPPAARAAGPRKTWSRCNTTAIGVHGTAGLKLWHLPPICRRWSR